MGEFEFDYVIVGAGSAGCVMANRLSADPSVRVCVVEAGPSDQHGLTAFKARIPVGNVFLLPSKRFNWGYAFKGHDGLRNREIPSHRGRMFGGTSSVNGMVYMRGHPRDYDEWGELGNPGWNYEEVLKVFRSQENHERGEDQFHGVGGALNVAAPRYINAITRAFITAAGQTQYKTGVDFNGASQEGFAPWELTQKAGQRWSSARAFLHPALSRSNLTVMQETLSLTILFSSKRATGVKVRRAGREFDLTARREVILCGGSYNSPHLLMLSGIGDADALQRLGISVVHHAPGVGKNLQDHPTAWIEMSDKSKKSVALNVGTLPRYALASIFYALFRQGPLASNNVEGGGFVRSLPGLERPDLQIGWLPGVRSPTQFIPSQHGFSVMPILLRPKSRGEIELVSPRAEDKPILHPRFLDHAEDIDTLIRGVAIGRQILSAPALAPYCDVELRPGIQVQSRDDIEAYLRQSVMTSFHPVGTCKMGPASDPMAVVDHQLKLRGIEGLRVADASIMPLIVGGNTNAPAMMIGDRGAQFAIDDAKRGLAA